MEFNKELGIETAEEIVSGEENDVKVNEVESNIDSTSVQDRKTIHNEDGFFNCYDKAPDNKMFEILKKHKIDLWLCSDGDLEYRIGNNGEVKKVTTHKAIRIINNITGLDITIDDNL